MDRTSGKPEPLIEPDRDGVPLLERTRVETPRGLFFLATCLLLIGLNLRTVFSSLSAILAEITAATQLSGFTIAVLTTVPVTFLGIFAPFAPALARRFGAERVLLGAMVSLTMGLAVRALEVPGAGHLPALLVGTGVCGAAIAVANVVLPSLVKRNFQHRLGLMSGLYTAAMCASAALAAGFTYPIFAASGSWEFSLFFWTIPAAVVMLLFAPIAITQRHGNRELPKAGPSVWRSSIAWQVTILMVLQAMMSFSVFAWLAPILRERGIDGDTAGAIVAVSIVLQTIGSFFAPTLATRVRDQRAVNVTVALMTGGGFALSIFGSLELIWVWTGLLGLGQGGLTAMALTLIVLRSRDSHTAARLSAMMQGVGYGVGSSGTLLVGQLYQWTGGFGAAGVMFLCIGMLAALFGYFAGRNRCVGEEKQLQRKASALTPLP